MFKKLCNFIIYFDFYILSCMNLKYLICIFENLYVIWKNYFIMDNEKISFVFIFFDVDWQRIRVE